MDVFVSGELFQVAGTLASPLLVRVQDVVAGDASVRAVTAPHRYSFIAVIVPPFLQKRFREMQRFHRHELVVEARLHIDFESFVNADGEGRERIFVRRFVEGAELLRVHGFLPAYEAIRAAVAAAWGGEIVPPALRV
jgi:hypothetical protein